ncbi:hypothetical protein GF357_03725, partial [Candidatus Dojkabacteria bacterium]|nr:hypothetical protein [Candidatus Dojkabacteria bacterium]
MAVASGVQMSSTHILPFMPGMKTVYSVSYRNNLSDKAKLKLHCYELHKNENMKPSQIAKVLNKHRSTIYRWINQTKKALQIRRYQYLEPKSRSPNSTPREKVITPEYE